MVFSLVDITSIAHVALLRQLASLDGSDVSARHRSHLSSVQPTGDEYQCPTFGLKRLLVQLIGHLCYRCPVVQDKVQWAVGCHVMSCDVMLCHVMSCDVM